jgi:hypothetical protein
METRFLHKNFLVLPLMPIADYVLMLLLRCSSCLFGFDDDFYCGTYCLPGKVMLMLSALFFIILFSPEIKHYLNRNKNAETF